MLKISFSKLEIEYQEMGYLSQIDGLGETIMEKDQQIKKYNDDNITLTLENSSLKKKVAKLETAKSDLLFKLDAKTKKIEKLMETNVQTPENDPSAISRILDNKLKAIKIQPPPILNKVCNDLVDPSYTNHGYILKTFKVDYQNGVIMGIDDVKTAVKTDEICKDCGRAIPLDSTYAFRYHRGVLSSLGGVPKSFGYFHSKCVNSLKYTPMVISRIAPNEQ